MRKKKTDPNEFETDDEALREEAIGDGETKIEKWTLRPVTALTISWMQRNRLFDDEKDLIWRASAFGFLQSEDLPTVRAVVNNRDEFAAAVDDWIEANIEHHNEVMELGKAMTQAFSRYMSSVSKVKGSSPGK